MTALFGVNKAIPGYDLAAERHLTDEGNNLPETPRKDTAMQPHHSILLSGMFAALVMVAHAFRQGTSPNHRHARFTERHYHHRREVYPESTATLWRQDQPQRGGLQALLAADRRAAQGRAQRAADHDRRPGLRRHQHLRRRHPDAGHGSPGEGGLALHAVPFHRALLADARGADHRPQPPLGGASA